MIWKSVQLKLGLSLNEARLIDNCSSKQTFIASDSDPPNDLVVYTILPPLIWKQTTTYVITLKKSLNVCNLPYIYNLGKILSCGRTIWPAAEPTNMYLQHPEWKAMLSNNKGIPSWIKCYWSKVWSNIISCNIKKVDITSYLSKKKKKKEHH